MLRLMSSPGNIHDALFRETMSRKDMAADFLRSYLPESVLAHIDLDSLAIAKDSFVDPEMKDSYSDLLYRVSFSCGTPGYIHFLFEHKSTPDRFLPLQLLRYMLGIWDLHRKQHRMPKGAQLPLVIPVVIYHGRPRRQAVRLSGLVATPHASLEAYIPDFAMEFFDFSLEADVQIKGRLALRLVLASLRAKNDPENARHVFEIFKLLSELDESQSSLRWIETIFRYLAQVMDISSQEMHNIATRTLSAGKEDTIMTLAEQLRKDGMQEGLLLGRQEGILEGRQEGLQEARHELLERLLRKRFGAAASAPQIRERLRRADAEQLDLWAERLLDAASMEEVFE